jgi:hypothetical protein
MIEYDELRTLSIFNGTYFFELAGSNEKFCSGSTSMPSNHCYGLAARRSDQFLELLSVEILPAVIDSQLD